MVQGWIDFTGSESGASALDALWADVQALRSIWLGTTEPPASERVAGMLWHRETDYHLLIRNSANSAWLELMEANRFCWRGTINAAANINLFSPQRKIDVVSFTLISDTATAGHDGTNHYNLDVQNLNGALSLFATVPDTSANPLLVNGDTVLTPDQNLTVATSDVLQLQITQDGTPAPLSLVDVAVSISYVPRWD